MLKTILQAIRTARVSRMVRSDPIRYARSIGVRIGANCRLLGITGDTFGSEPYLIKLGDHVTVTSGVRFVTHDGGVWVFRQEYPNIDVFGPIQVGNNVFIGLCSIILPGVKIGDNCVIGAGSVVTKDVPAGTVAVGTPARTVRNLSEYRERTLKVAMHIRDMPEAEKRVYLEKRFWSQ
jgi:acetyltransferase-like isoleucine patch superfamily enzyme